jgi:adenylate cyclase
MTRYDGLGILGRSSEHVMPIEIERKFLVIEDGWKQGASRVRRLKQAYLTINDKLSIRVRIEGTAAALTIKSASAGRQRAEYEYAIPLADAEFLMRQREGSVIAKTRYLVPVGELTWEVDVFEGDNAGLVIAEIELDRVDRQFDRPAWIGNEVTNDRRYYNADLARVLFRQRPRA